MLSPRLFSPPGINYSLVRCVQPTLSAASVAASLRCDTFAPRYMPRACCLGLLPGAIIFSFSLARLRLKILFRDDREEARLVGEGVMELADEQLSCHTKLLFLITSDRRSPSSSRLFILKSERIVEKAAAKIKHRRVTASAPVQEEAKNKSKLFVCVAHIASPAS